MHKMIVTKIETFPIRLPYGEPIADARSTITHRATVLVRIETDSGVFGWGEAAAFGDVANEVACIIRTRLASHVIGKVVSPRDARRVLTKKTAHFGQRGLVTSAISGLDIALWDALARAAGLPLCQLLGGSPTPIKLYGGTGYYAGKKSTKSKDLELLERSLLAPQGDFRGAKIKIGRYGLPDDIARVRLARQVLGPKAILIADANNAYSFHEALKFARQVEAYDLHFLEEPIEFGQPRVSADLRRASPVRIAGYELEMTYTGFLPYIQQRSVDVLQPDCIWSGGILECLEIATAAQRAGIAISPHNFASMVSTAANYHFLCAAGGDVLEVDGTSSPLLKIPLEVDARTIRDGQLVIAGKPGLGIVPDLDYVRVLSNRTSPTANKVAA